jgi:chondroitin AC lyase
MMWYRISIAFILFLSLLCTSFVTVHSLNDDISVIRQRVLQSMIWPANTTISAIIKQAILYARTLNNSYYWPDIDYNDQSVVVWKTEEHMFRITTMIQALTVPGSTVHNDTKLLSAIHCALNIWLINDWRNPNWFFNQIGIPLQATSQLLMLGDNVTSFEIEKIKEISYRAAWWNGGGQTTGANLIWMIQIQLYRSLATTNITGIEQGFARMWKDIVVVSLNEEGVQNDWSYHFHGKQIQSASYGALWVMDIFSFFLCSYKTQYAPNAEQLLIFAQFLTKGDAWMLIGFEWDWHVVGRGLSTPFKHYSVGFNRYSIRFLAQFIDRDDIKRELISFADRLDGKPNATLFIGNKHFYTSDYQIHRRNNWTSAIKIQSIRTFPTECINGENQKAEHVGQGTLNLFTTNTNDYDYIFPLLDWQAINGITVEHDIPLEPCIHGTFDWEKLSFVGGVSDGYYGLAIMDTASHNLTVQRSWHFYDDAIIALATNLTLTTPTTAWTTLASRLLTTGQISIGFFNSTTVTLSDGNYSFQYVENKTSNVQWMHVGGTNTGYLLQVQGLYSTSGVSLGTKTGNYDTIGPFNYTVTGRLLTIWINHGQGPYTLDYGYIIVPNVSLELMPTLIKQYDEEQIFSCISTNNFFHGTMWLTLKRASFVLWDNITTTFSCNSSMFQITMQINDAGAYLFSETMSDFTAVASHPTRMNGNLKITLFNRIGYGEGCNTWSYGDTSHTNVTLTLPSSPELQGASVNVTCRKQNINTL